MRIVLLGDLGSVGGYHAGDEAMAEAVVEQIRSRVDVQIVAISGDPGDTVARYGWDAVPRMGFGAPLRTDAQREARLDAVLSAAGGDITALAWSDDAWKVIHAVDEADAVVISGGGNLSSTWPEHVYERAALARLAALFGKRHVVTGQTIGPQLTSRHGELVGQALTSAALVGAREEPSYELALRLGVLPDRLVRVLDDAENLAPVDMRVPLPAGPYISATFSPDSGPLDANTYISSIAALLDHVTRTTDLPVFLVPHHATESDGVATGDLVTHSAIAAAVRSGTVISLPPTPARQIVDITRNSSLVISTRYHPVVFALAASVPAIGIAVDGYTSTKIRGAMENYGVGDFAISVASLVEGGALTAADDLLARADTVTEHLERVNTIRRTESALWWDAVTSVLEGAAITSAPAGLAAVAPIKGGDWTITGKALRNWNDLVSARFDADRLANANGLSEVALLHEQIDLLERELATEAADLSASADEIDSLRASTRAAHELVSAQLGPLAKKMENLPSVEALRAELNAVYNTRTFRYLRGPRMLYRKLRA